MDAAVVVDLVEAMSRCHTEATCAAAALDVLAKHYRVARVELGAGRRGAVVVLDPAAGRCSLTDADVGLLERVLAATHRQIEAMARVATLSRTAHAKIKHLDECLKDAVLPKSIVAVAPATRRIFTETIPLIARRDTSVLVLGETGTGKELVAQRIHQLSPRARRPFVRVNCGAIPSELVESTLFGHEPGSFTGAIRRQIGVFERANDGTLFLDEIGELPLSSQVKLLRVLESGELERVGGDRTIRVNVRIIAATHRDLEALVAQRSFREDLYYRLNVFPISVPALRDRRAEIPELTRQILGELAQRFGVPEPVLDWKAAARLRAYSWPGNVRELRNVLERSLLVHGAGEFQLDLPVAPRAAAESFEQGARRTIEAALVASGGRIYGTGGAAMRLGLKPTTLVSKMKRLGIAVKGGRRRPSPPGAST